MCELQAVIIKALLIWNSEIDPNVDSSHINIKNVTASQYMKTKNWLGSFTETVQILEMLLQ